MLKVPSPVKKRSRGTKRRLASLSLTALDALEEILVSSEVKPADRISAAKLVFELSKQNASGPSDGGTLRVVFDGIPQELCE